MTIRLHVPSRVSALMVDGWKFIRRFPTKMMDPSRCIKKELISYNSLICWEIIIEYEILISCQRFNPVP